MRERPGTWSVIALATLMLCSCRAPWGGNEPWTPLTRRANRPQPAASSPQGYAPEAQLVSYEAAFSSAPPPLPCPIGCRDCASGTAMAMRRGACNSADECVCDGGDRGLGVNVAPDWKVRGLDPQDTIAHFDTLDGRTHVEASNKVCLYAPRFGAVRVVSGLIENEQSDRADGIELKTRAVTEERAQLASTSLQREGLGDHAAAMLPEGFRTRQGDGLLSKQVLPYGYQDGFMPYENLRLIRSGEFDNREKGRLASAIDAAIVWSADQAVQVLLDGKQAKGVQTAQKAQSTYMVEDNRRAALRLFKLASTDNAQSGDIVDFTIRFDNVGTAPLGNIVVIDHLTPRLEYVSDSAQASVAANFSATTQEVGTLVLRWEIDEPLEAGQGGLVRFKCRVR